MKLGQHENEIASARRGDQHALEHLHGCVEICFGHQIDESQQIVRFKKIGPQLNRTLEFRSYSGGSLGRKAHDGLHVGLTFTAKCESVVVVNEIILRTSGDGSFQAFARLNSSALAYSEDAHRGISHCQIRIKSQSLFQVGLAVSAVAVQEQI